MLKSGMARLRYQPLMLSYDSQRLCAEAYRERNVYCNVHMYVSQALKVGMGKLRQWAWTTLLCLSSLQLYVPV